MKKAYSFIISVSVTSNLSLIYNLLEALGIMAYHAQLLMNTSLACTAFNYIVYVARELLGEL